MKPKCIFFILFIFIILTNNSCKKEEGEGGTSSIIGRVKALDYRYDGAIDSFVLDTTYYLPGERVYIVYGDDEVYSDDFRTDPNGYYRFQWLRKGKYTIFAYAQDTIENTPTGVYHVEVSVEIKKNKTEYTAPDIEVVRL